MRQEHTDFIFSGLATVEGYIDPADALIFLCLLSGQTDRGLTGGLAEIGVYYGRSWFLMRRLAAPGEKVLAIDLFDMEGGPGTGSGQYRRFLDHGDRLGLPVDEALVIAGDSTRLAPADITGRTGPVRFFSVDGGHMLEHVAADSLLARDSLAPHGIIAFDDSFNPEWPEVTAGLIDFLRANRETHAAFCVSNKKTYVCHRDWLETYREMIGQSPLLRKFTVAPLDFLGDSAVRVHHPVTRRIGYELMKKAGLSGLSSRIYGL